MIGEPFLYTAETIKLGFNLSSLNFVGQNFVKYAEIV